MRGAESCQPPGTCAEPASMWNSQLCAALTRRSWMSTLGRCSVICCCPHEIIHSQTARILNWTSPCQTQTRPPHPFFFPGARFDRSHPQKHSEPIWRLSPTVSNRLVLTVTLWWTSSLMMSEIPAQLLWYAVIIAILLSAVQNKCGIGGQTH